MIIKSDGTHEGSVEQQMKFGGKDLIIFYIIVNYYIYESLFAQRQQTDK